jgi:hypothetical protein
MKDYMDQVITQSKNGIDSVMTYLNFWREPETASLKRELKNPLQIEYKEPNPKNTIMVPT